MLKQTNDFTALQGKLSEFVTRGIPPNEASEVSLSLQALMDIHLKLHLGRELEVNGNLTQVYVFF